MMGFCHCEELGDEAISIDPATFLREIARCARNDRTVRLKTKENAMARQYI